MTDTVADKTLDRLDALEARARDTDRQLRTVRGNATELMADMAAKVGELVDRLDVSDRRVAALKQGLNDTVDVIGRHEDRITAIHELFIKRMDQLAREVTLMGDRTYLPTGSLASRFAVMDAALARIEDMLTAERNPCVVRFDESPAASIERGFSQPIRDGNGAVEGCGCYECNRLRGIRKRIHKGGWLNVYRYGAGYRLDDIPCPDKRAVDGFTPSGERIACIKIPDITEGEGL